MGDDGSVSLDIGRVSGLGAGSEFTSMVPNSARQKIVLRVTSLDGLARSSAQIVSPAGAKVGAGDVFELSKWVPADNPPLRIWLWPSNLTEEQILAAAAQVQGIRSRSCLRSRGRAVDACDQLGRYKLDTAKGR